MKRLTINGKDKKPYDYCPTCRNGKLMSKEQYFQTDMLGNNYKEHICVDCNTRYNQPYIPLDIKVENFIAENISLETYKKWAQSNGSSLTTTNAAYHMIRIGLMIKKERKMLSTNIEKYEKTGICVNHELKKSHPFKTAEGTFQLECCPICMKAQIKYKGITYNDSVMSIVRYIAHQGVEFEKTQTIVLPSFDIEMIKETEKATQELPNFDIEEETPDWNILTEPQW